MTKLRVLEMLRWPMCVVLCVFCATLPMCNSSCNKKSIEKAKVNQERVKLCSQKYPNPVDLQMCTGDILYTGPVSNGSAKNPYENK